jgi:nucleoside-diphosphate-sugar epimerase
MKLLVSGATGFTGSHLLPLLLARGYDVRCFVRPSSDTSLLPEGKVELAYGNLDDQSSLEQALKGVDALINVASLGFGHAPNVVGAAVRSGTRRAIFISTTAIFTTLDAPSKASRLAAEETIRKSGLDFTILRPTMIYGSSRDRNMCRLIRYLKRWPVIPIFGDGECLQQPVYVEDVALAVRQSLEKEQTVGHSYNISGAEPLTYNRVIDTVCEQMKRRVHKIHFPVAPVASSLKLFERLSLRLPVKAEQILRLNEHKAFDFSDAARDFGYEPRPFAEGIKLELQEMTGDV